MSLQIVFAPFFEIKKYGDEALFCSWYTFPYQVNKNCVLDIKTIPNIIRVSAEKYK